MTATMEGMRQIVDDLAPVHNLSHERRVIHEPGQVAGQYSAQGRLHVYCLSHPWSASRSSMSDLDAEWAGHLEQTK